MATHFIKPTLTLTILKAYNSRRTHKKKRGTFYQVSRVPSASPDHLDVRQLNHMQIYLS